MKIPLRTRMILNAKAYNNVLTREKLNSMSTIELYNNCHPNDRKSFYDEMNAAMKLEVKKEAEDVSL
jgi:hypothetical protein